MAADLDARKNYEKELINKARDLSDSLDQQKLQLNKCDEDLEQPNVKPAGKTAANDAKVNEVITLRNQLMKCMNEISMLEEKSQENTYQLEVLTEHRRLMSLEKDRQPDPERMREQAVDLKRTNELDDKALKIMASTIKQATVVQNLKYLNIDMKMTKNGRKCLKITKNNPKTIKTGTNTLFAAHNIYFK